MWYFVWGSCQQLWWFFLNHDSESRGTFPMTSSLHFLYSALLCSWRTAGMMPLAQGRIHTWMPVIPLWRGPGRLWVGALSPTSSPVLTELPFTPLPPSVLHCFEAVTAIALNYCHGHPWCKRQMCKWTQGTHICQHCIWSHSQPLLPLFHGNILSNSW